jgi:hypothetical protein
MAGVTHAASDRTYIPFEHHDAQPAAARSMRVSKPGEARAHNAYVCLDCSRGAA